jgi:hypothetical protein
MRLLILGFLIIACSSALAHRMNIHARTVTMAVARISAWAWFFVAGCWRIGSSDTPRTFADNQRMVCAVFRYSSLPSPRVATEKIQRCRCFSARAVFRCTADFDCRAHLSRLRAAPALLAAMNPQLFVSARALSVDIAGPATGTAN